MDAPCLRPQVHQPVHQAIGKRSCCPWGQADNRQTPRGMLKALPPPGQRPRPCPSSGTHPPAPAPSPARSGINQPARVGDQIKCSKQIKSREEAGKCTAFKPCLVNFGLLFRGGECSGCLVHTRNYCWKCVCIHA